VLVETANRVRVIADIHRALYAAPNVDQVDLSAFGAKLAESLFALYSGVGARVRLELRTEQVTMDLQRAVPIGLILNELFCNALKHAFPGNRRGTIRLSRQRSQPGWIGCENERIIHSRALSSVHAGTRRAALGVRRWSLGDDPVEQIEVRRLGEVAIESGLFREREVLGPSVAAQGQQKGRLGRSIGAEGARDLVAIHPREPDVADHYFGRKRFDELDSARSIRGGSNLVAFR
jgi:two-component sensor histidine kinase